MDIISKFLVGKKKFLAFLVATVFLPVGLIPPEQWFGVTMLFVGAEAGLDLFNKKQDSKKETEVPKDA